MGRLKKQITTTISKEEYKWAELNDVIYSEALSLGLKIMKKRNEGLAGLINEEKKTLKQLEMLNNKLIVVREEIKNLENKEIEKDKLKKVEAKKKINECPVCFDNLVNKKFKTYKNKKFCSMNCISIYRENSNKDDAKGV